MPVTKLKSEWVSGNLQFRPNSDADQGELLLANAAGTATRKVGGLAYRNVAASAAVTNTTTETAFDQSVTIPAASLKAGSVLKVRAQVIATATNATDTLTLKLYVGTVEIATTGAVDVANSDIGYIDADIVFRTIGASGTLVGTGCVALGVPGTVTAKPFLKASATVDTTAALAITVQATWSVANAGNSCRLDVITVEQF